MRGRVKQLFLLLKMEIIKTYSGSMLGIAWFILNPFLYAFIYYLLFEKILQVKFHFRNYDSSYFQYLILGLILWSAFSSALLRGTTAIIENGYMLKKVPFSPINYVIVYTTIPFIQAIIILLFFLPFYKVINPVLILYFSFSFILLYLYTLGLSLFLSSLTVYIRDISQLVSNLLNFVFFTVPIIYPYNQIPKNIKNFISLNPLFYLFKNIYNAVFYKTFELDTLFLSIIISGLTFLLGISTYRYLKKGFYEVL